ncbi:MAG TPA: hypothetical protein VFV78_13095 [Vicinamibacterales bacterium]|nr:hypothetical protein [Vicinamibacterales bacterium]
MSRAQSVLAVSALAAILVAVVPLHASDPVGAYTIVEKVVLAPNPTAPTTAQIFGVFSFAVPRNKDFTQPWPPGSFGTANTGDVYAAVQKGYLFYSCPAGRETACRAEWNDLGAVAGKGDVVGFGTRWAMTGRVRQASEAPANPDVYPLNVGVVKMGIHAGTTMQNRSQYPDLIAALQAASRSK